MSKLTEALLWRTFSFPNRQGVSGFQLGVVLGEKRPAKNTELESSQMSSLAFFRIATQPAKRLEEATFNIETNQGFFKEQDVRWLTKPYKTNIYFIVCQYALNLLVWSVTTCRLKRNYHWFARDRGERTISVYINFLLVLFCIPCFLNHLVHKVMLNNGNYVLYFCHCVRY